MFEEFPRGPADHQRRCAEILATGKSVILRAPTGSGKSEAVWLPFLHFRGNPLPMRMIHVLPMRALANQLEIRMTDWTKKVSRSGSVRVAAMHGKRPESVLFYADALFATLDQVVTSYTCTPLSLSARQGNIPAGAVAGSFLVFDEVHTFAPSLGLQSIFVLAERATRMRIPFVIMSATLPEAILDRLEKRFSANRVEGCRIEDLKHPRRVAIHLHKTRLTGREVLERSRQSGKVIVVVNTVKRALGLYEGVRSERPDAILAHSRFYDDDRQKKEVAIESLFGKNADRDEPALLIATQVVEVGLDISCDLLLTELAPIDALVQRAGRCARWGGAGEVRIFTNLETERPYSSGLVGSTRQALEKKGIDGEELTWDLEKALVDTVLPGHLQKWAEPEMAGKVLSSLAEAAFTGNSQKAEATVRDSVSVEVALYSQPQGLGNDIFLLPRCRVHPGVFRQFLKEHEPLCFRVVVDRKPEDDYSAQIDFVPITANSDLMPAALYVVDPKFASCDHEYGLRLGVPGQAGPLSPAGTRPPLQGILRRELWQDHVRDVIARFEECVLPREEVAFTALARMLGKSEQELFLVTKLVLVLHDAGKLAEDWQRIIRAGLEGELGPDQYLAHRGEKVGKLPPHATVSAWVATPCLIFVAGERWRETLAVPALAAIAHHHSVRATMTPAFKMADGWFDLVAACARGLAGFEASPQHFNTRPPRTEAPCGVGANFLLPVPYSAYVLLARWLRLSDRIATGGGEDTLLRYEEWAANK